MRKVLIDTNIYSSFKRNDPDIVSAGEYARYLGAVAGHGAHYSFWPVIS